MPNSINPRIVIAAWLCKCLTLEKALGSQNSTKKNSQYRKLQHKQ